MTTDLLRVGFGQRKTSQILYVFFTAFVAKLRRRSSIPAEQKSVEGSRHVQDLQYIYKNGRGRTITGTVRFWENMLATLRLPSWDFSFNSYHDSLDGALLFS